ncbi:MAG: TVP38/TMEM64 family protein [Planctomycetota bacterium]|jgi:uncharacterized membrane protein YdjX (TVP38/TMEM64 family)
MSGRPACAENSRHVKKVVRIILIVAVIATLLISAKIFDLQQIFRDTLAWISGLGSIAPLIFIAIYVLACVLLLPGSILTLGAGVVFGAVKGSIVVSIASTLGATCAFLVGRYLARGWVTGKIAGNENFKAIDDAVAREGWKIVLLTRLSPVFPFNLLNYAFGLTQVGTIMYVYIGSLAGDLASLGTGDRTRTTGEWILYGVGLLATLAVTVFVTRLAKRSLAGRIRLEENRP